MKAFLWTFATAIVITIVFGGIKLAQHGRDKHLDKPAMLISGESEPHWLEGI